MWEKYRDELSADHTEQFATAYEAYLEALRDIERLLIPCGSNLSNFVLPDAWQRVNDHDIEQETFSPRIDILSHTALDMISRMNPEKPAAFDVMYAAIASASPAQTVFYLDSNASSGKSSVASALWTRLQFGNCIPILVGTTELRVMIYERGRTTHSAFRIPFVMSVHTCSPNVFLIQCTV